MWVKEAEIMKAKAHDVYSYLRYADPGELVRLSCNEYCLKSHDSFKISNGMWHWYSQNIGGRTAVDYLIKVKGYSFPEAVIEVNRAMGDIAPEKISHKNVKKKLKLPHKSVKCDVVLEYLISRGLDESLIKDLTNEGLIFQSKPYDSVVFIGLNEDGKPAHAAYRGRQIFQKEITREAIKDMLLESSSKAVL